MKLPRRQFIRLTAAATVLPAISRIARAQTYPTRTITLIVPFPPGGSTDPAGRIVAARMAEILGQPVIVENVGGASGSIGVSPTRQVPRDVHEYARDVTRRLMRTKAFLKSRDE